MQGDGPGEEEERDTPLADTSGSLMDSLLDQLHFASLDERQEAIGQQLIGSIDGDGYIRRDLSAIANDLAFSQNLEVTVAEIEAVLRVVQGFDPPGIAARDLPECLLLQLERRPQDENTVNAERILTDTFEEFSKKHYPRIQQKLDLEDDELKEAINVILKLNPKPGGSGPSGLGKTQYLMPDFILTNDNGVLQPDPERPQRPRAAREPGLHRDVPDLRQGGQEGPEDEGGRDLREAEARLGQVVYRRHPAAPEHAAAHHERHCGAAARVLYGRRRGQAQAHDSEGHCPAHRHGHLDGEPGGQLQVHSNRVRHLPAQVLLLRRHCHRLGRGRQQPRGEKHSERPHRQGKQGAAR